ncbi:MAG: D-aminoacylase [Spirochaetes bacterium]|nr:D-aminoacylase [Spirochaetota bacterium]
MLDLIIKKGLIVDGKGKKAYHADIGIQGEKIKKIGNLTSFSSRKYIDAEGLTVAPGFIDMHSHSDLGFLSSPFTEPKIMQGITTEVVGNCGMSLAPVEKTKLALLKKYLAPFQGGIVELPWDWKSFGEYLNHLQEHGTAVNVISLIGHGTIRTAVMGFENRPATSPEMRMMKSLLKEAMEQGAFGLSTGLIYPPGVYTPTSELIELCREVNQKGGLYVSHMRNEDYKLIESIREVIKIGREASVPVHISHFKVLGKENRGKTKEALELIEKVRKEGLDITCDQYPYTACSTVLSALLPPWVHQGGVTQLIARLQQPHLRKKIKEEMEVSYKGILKECGGWHNVFLSYCGKHTHWEGKNIQETAEEENKSPYELFFDLLIEGEAEATMIFFAMDKQDVQRILKYPYTMIGTDGLPARGKPHPRLYGTFPRILSRYVREERILSLEEAVRKMTALPAEKLNLKGRGLIREGMYADLVVFSQDKISDQSTYENPRRYPEGIEYVLVNGGITVDKGNPGKGLFGKVLLHHKNGE